MSYWQDSQKSDKIQKIMKTLVSEMWMIQKFRDDAMQNTLTILEDQSQRSALEKRPERFYTNKQRFRCRAESESRWWGFREKVGDNFRRVGFP